jgi:hypothetical protein
MPGQRKMVVVSPGFFTSETDMLQDYMHIVERALHSEVMISTLDARGLYAFLPGAISAENCLEPNSYCPVICGTLH